MVAADNASGEQNTGANAPTYTLTQVVNAALALGLPVAAWRLPLATEVQVCISLDMDFVLTQPDIENSPFGFLFSPFIVGDQQPIVFIKAAIVYSSETGRLQFSSEVIPAQQQEFITAINYIQITPTWHQHAAEVYHEQTEVDFKDAVTEAIQSINAGHMEKVVLSRTATKPLPVNFNLITAYISMLDADVRAFVSLVSVPEIGTWLGESPEILVSIN